MKRLVTLAAVAIAGCSINDLAATSADRVYSSPKAKDDIAECLLDRLASVGRLERRTAGDAVQVTLTSGAARIGVYLFTIRNAGGGSVTELRKLNGPGSPGLHNAETCF